MEKRIKEYMNFKLAQYCRINGFDYKQKDAKKKLTAITKENLEQWVKEAVAANAA